MPSTSSVLNPAFELTPTRRFAVLQLYSPHATTTPRSVRLVLTINEKYTTDVVLHAAARRGWCTVLTGGMPTAEDLARQRTGKEEKGSLAHMGAPQREGTTTLQIGDFENIEWDTVMTGQCSACSYLVRKGLARKAQLALQLRRHVSKHPDSILKTAVPYTLILDTWNAFEEMKLDFGRGTFATFDDPALMNAPLRQKIDWCLNDARDAVQSPDCADWCWILKPSVVNKGADISVVCEWGEVLSALETVPDIREWVLQRYIEPPLLCDGYKFHLRVYVLCVGALQVYVFEEVLMLLAAHRYEFDADGHDWGDIYKHLTNTARGVEDDSFDEDTHVRLLCDLPAALLLQQQQWNEADKTRDRTTSGASSSNGGCSSSNNCSKVHKRINSLAEAEAIVGDIRRDIREITGELFAAYENEYSIFCPMGNCFELYGLDFMVDSAFNVSLLEVNPGPDFKQTGQRLHCVIANLWEQVFRLVVDTPVLDPSISHCSTTSSDRNCSRHSAQEQEEVGVAPVVGQAAPRCPDLTCVYSKEWSVSKLNGGLSFSK